jgi:hypothetical protein
VRFYFNCFIKRRFINHTPLWSSPVDRICKITWTTEDIELQAGGNCSLSPHWFTLKCLQCRRAHVPLNSRMSSLLMNRESQCSITGILYVVTLAHNKWGFIDWDICSKLIFALENSSVLIYLSSVSP